MKPLTILHDEERLFVVAKPPGLLTVAPPKRSSSRGDDTLIDRLHAEGHSAHAVHRIDRETSGAVLVAKDPAMREELMAAFKARSIEKGYLAFVCGVVHPAEGELRFRIKDLGAKAVIASDGQPAVTRYRVTARYGLAARVEIELVTGRHNQVRIHFAHIGHPLVGERKYARGKDSAVRHKRAALHAERLAFDSPTTGDRVEVRAPLPQDLENLVAKLEASPRHPGGAGPARDQRGKSRARKRR